MCLMGHPGFQGEVWPVSFLLTGPCHQEMPACHLLPLLPNGGYPVPVSPAPPRCLRLKGARKVGHMAGGSWSLYPGRKKSGRCLLMEAPCPTVLAHLPQLEKVCAFSIFPGRYGHAL